MSKPTAPTQMGMTPASLLPATPSPVREWTGARSWSLPEWCAVAQVAGPALLYLPGSQSFRLPLRFSVFGISLLALALCLRRRRVSRPHPAWKVLAIAAVYLGLMILHPTTNTTLAGLAQVCMFLAVASPLSWAPDYFLGDIRRLARILTILWAFNGASVVVGILQVRDPNTWMPAEFSSIETGSKYRIASLRYRTSDNRMVVRPPGLGDSPGAVCGAGLFVASVGVVCLGLPISAWKKATGLVMGMAGVAVIFLSMVRSSLVVLLGGALIYLVLMVMQRRWWTVVLLTCAMVLGGFGSLQYATFLGGQSVVNRFASLVEDDPLTVYDRSARMGMVTHAFDSLLVEYPFGAGLGRYGMMRAYFGDENNLDSPSIWAEVQFPAWVLDGGIVLLSLYVVAIFVSLRRLLQITLTHRSQEVRQWAGVIVMLSASPIALMFSYCPFLSQMGMQFWLLVGAIEGVASRADASPRNRLPRW